MLDFGLSRQLAVIRFNDRATVRDGTVTYRLADRSGHVSLDAAEWCAMLDQFDIECRKVRRTRNLWLIGLAPGILVYGMTLAHVLPLGGIVILAGIFLGPPAIYLWQSNRIERLARRIEEELSCRARVAAPRRARWRVPPWLEIACAVLVGPHLIFEVYGSLNPAAYRNTPLLGTQLNWTSFISFGILAAILYLRWRAGKESSLPSLCSEGRNPQPQAKQGRPVTATFGQKVDPLARARDAGH